MHNIKVIDASVLHKMIGGADIGHQVLRGTAQAILEPVGISIQRI
jgi:hypothetical protein